MDAKEMFAAAKARDGTQDWSRAYEVAFAATKQIK